ncbi:MAG: transcription elongation factor GreA [Saprospiraceae bacterium]|nr:transcription elongation factor GreA [Saprospiraceae bacterium]
MSKISYMTKESYDKFKGELQILKEVGRKEAAQAIAEAREKGDLSENAEYDAAKDAQGMLEAKINSMEKVMASVQILDESTVDTSIVSVLTKVTIKNMAAGKEMTYKLVSESEASVKEKKISVESPIGKGLLGKKVGETAEVTTPRGTMKFEIMNITI